MTLSGLIEFQNHMKRIILIFISTALFSCNNETKTEVKSNSPDLFGWTEQNIFALKNECFERYGNSKADKNEKQKINYCNCFVEKIIYSVKFEQYRAPGEETVKLLEEFSNACEVLTKNNE